MSAVKIKNYNEKLIFDYVKNYQNLDIMYDAYNNYSRLILDWAGNMDLMHAPKFKKSFIDFLKTKEKKNGGNYKPGYIYSAALFLRDFFKYCKSELTEYETVLITDKWLKTIVPSRGDNGRTSFGFLTNEELYRLCDTSFSKYRLKRTQAAILLSAVTGMSRTAVMTIPIKEIDFKKKLVYQYTDRGVYTEKLASGTTRIFRDEKIIDFLKEYTRSIQELAPDNELWFLRLDRHSNPVNMPRYIISEDTQRDVYRSALSSYSKLKEDLLVISNMCKISKLSMNVAQNTFIKRRLETENRLQDMKEIAKDLLIKDVAPIRRCKKMMCENNTQQNLVVK